MSTEKQVDIWGGWPLKPVDSLKEVAEKAGQDISKLQVSLLYNLDGTLLEINDRTEIHLNDGDNISVWKSPPIRSLFRGDRRPPSDDEMDRYPEEYVGIFFSIEKIISSVYESDLLLYDQNFIEVYSAMRRRPDGRSCNLLHDIIWQATALTLGLREISEAEYIAVFQRLERSARHFKMGPLSMNYVEYLVNGMNGGLENIY